MKIYAFVFVYKPKDENKKTYGLGVYGTDVKGKELFGISEEVERRRGYDHYVLGAILGMEKALEMGADEIEVLCSNSGSAKRMSKPLSRELNTMNLHQRFYDLKYKFRIATFKYIREMKNKGGKKMAIIGAGEKIWRKWV